MIVAVAIVGMVQSALDEIADMVAVGHGFMAASRPVHMVRIVAEPARHRGAARRVCGAVFNDVLVDMVAVGVMQAAVVEVIHMVAVAHRGVTAVRAMDVGMGFMLVVIAGHDRAPMLAGRRVSVRLSRRL